MLALLGVDHKHLTLSFRRQRPTTDRCVWSGGEASRFLNVVGGSISDINRAVVSQGRTKPLSHKGALKGQVKREPSRS